MFYHIHFYLFVVLNWRGFIKHCKCHIFYLFVCSNIGGGLKSIGNIIFFYLFVCANIGGGLQSIVNNIFASLCLFVCANIGAGL